MDSIGFGLWGPMRDSASPELLRNSPGSSDDVRASSFAVSTDLAGVFAPSGCSSPQFLSVPTPSPLFLLMV